MSSFLPPLLVRLQFLCIISLFLKEFTLEFAEAQVAVEVSSFNNIGGDAMKQMAIVSENSVVKKKVTNTNNKRGWVEHTRRYR